MTDRERLIELITDYDRTYDCEFCTKAKKCEHCGNECLADYLLENSVIVPPCKVGDTVYVISRYYTGTWKIYSCTVEYITKYKSNSFINAVFSRDINFGLNIVEFGKTIFLTREEAEKALAERSVSDVK